MNSLKTLAATMAVALVFGLVSRGIMAQTPTPAPAKDNGALADETLKTMLVNLGYEPREDKLKDGGAIFHVKVSRGGLSYDVMVVFSTDRQKLWTSTSLADVAQGVDVPATRLLKLLDLNDEIGPNFFTHAAKFNKIYMVRAADNRGITPKVLKNEIEDLTATCEKTREHWDMSKWPEIKTASAPK